MLKTRRLSAIAGLSAVGIALSAYLTFSHFAFLRTGLPSVCNINQTLNCDVVNSSRWSELGGVPVSHLGTVFYVGLLLLALLARRGGRLAERGHGYLLLAALGSGLFSAFLGAVSVFQVGALCLFCMGLYAVNALLLLALLPGVWAALRALVTEPDAGRAPAALTDLGALAQVPAAALLTIYVLLAVGSSWLVRAKLAELRTLSAASPAAKTADRLAASATGGAAAPATQQARPEPRIDLDSQTAPTLGPPTAKVTIVEISDFECPFCQRASGTLKEVLAAYPGQIRVVFRHFPLDQACNPLLKRPVHENACAAARAAVCAAGRGKFWPLAEKLFAGSTDPEDLLAARRELRLDDAEQTACLARPETAAVVAADIAAATQAGITAVPVFLINGRPLRGARPLADFRRIIDGELASAQAPAAPN